jgi:pimeloyl-ACP methyl ester carboxylesterase
MRMVPIILVAAFIALFLMALWGDFGPRRADSSVVAEHVPGEIQQRVFVLVHGFNPKPCRWDRLSGALKAHGDVLRLSYDARPVANGDPHKIAQAIGEAVAEHAAGKEVVIVAHSMGALLARRAVLDGLEQKLAWADRVTRMVLLAGMNRGWTVEGERAPDASWGHALMLRSASWLSAMLGIGELATSMQRGAPFVSNLRLDWMQYMRKAGVGIEVVQLLGDIDDLVSREDNEDLRTTGVGQFALLRVRGTGHGDILDIGDGNVMAGLKAYRREKLLLAATRPFHEVRRHNEALPHPVNYDVQSIVFVLHGIRDLGRWSSAFETEVKRHDPSRIATLRFESPRYGYLGMGPFLFAGVRDRYVRWFMDEYTEAVARHPKVKAETIHFFGHSNGTYVLTEALEKYRSMRVGNIVVAGSVVRTSYGWRQLGDRVGAARNYVGSHDWVVALFPRLFELPGFGAFKNRLGSGGFHGFVQSDRVENVFVQGAHGAFDGHEKEIVQFLLGPPAMGTQGPAVNRQQLDEQRSWWQSLLGVAPVALGVWVALVLMVFYVGIRVVGAAPSPTWPVMLGFALLVVTILRTV